MSEIDDLLDYIFDGARPAFYPEFDAWVRGSRRYRAFAALYRAKIRAKLRNATRNAGPDGHVDGLDDVRAELEAAALLLREERFTVEYETYAARKQRGPDFTVTFKGHTPFNVEVRRVRGGEDGDDARAARLAAVLCDKVGQMPPGLVNLLWLLPEGDLAPEDVARAALALQRLAEHKDEAYFARWGFDSAADFLKQYARLSGVALRLPGQIDLWLNPIARHKAPREIIAALRHL